MTTVTGKRGVWESNHTLDADAAPTVEFSLIEALCDIVTCTGV